MPGNIKIRVGLDGIDENLYRVYECDYSLNGNRYRTIFSFTPETIKELIKKFEQALKENNDYDCPHCENKVG